MKPHRRYSEEEKKALLLTMERAQEQSREPLCWVLAELGLTYSVYYDWLGKAKTGSLADRSVPPRSPLAALPEEIEATVAYAKAHPREGVPPAYLDDRRWRRGSSYPLPQSTEFWTGMNCFTGGRVQSWDRAGKCLKQAILLRYSMLT